MEFTLTFDMDGDIFVPDHRPELIRLLGTVSTMIGDRGAKSGTVRDINGNTIGSWAISERSA